MTFFKNRDMGKVVICCNDDNFASIADAKKLDFTLGRQHPAAFCDQREDQEYDVFWAY